MIIFSSFFMMAYIYTMVFRKRDPIDYALPDPPPEGEYPLGDSVPDPLTRHLSEAEKVKRLDDELDNMYKRR